MQKNYRVKKNEEDIIQINKDLESLSITPDEIQGLIEAANKATSDVAAMQTTINDHEARITTNASNISKNVDSINSINTEISTIKTTYAKTTVTDDLQHQIDILEFHPEKSVCFLFPSFYHHEWCCHLGQQHTSICSYLNPRPQHCAQCVPNL